MDSQSVTVAMELTVWGNIKKDVGVETTGAATGEFYCALDATLSVPVRLCLFPWGRV